MANRLSTQSDNGGDRRVQVEMTFPVCPMEGETPGEPGLGEREKPDGAGRPQPFPARKKGLGVRDGGFGVESGEMT